MVPCNCVECTKENSGEPTFFAFNVLKQYERENNEFIDCIKVKIKKIPVRSLIDDMVDYKNEKEINEDRTNNDNWHVEQLTKEKNNRDKTINLIEEKNRIPNVKEPWYKQFWVIIAGIVAFLAGLAKIIEFIWKFIQGGK
jgi:hypothetical protein